MEVVTKPVRKERQTPKPYACHVDECEERTSSEIGLWIHIRAAHQPNGHEVDKCKDCQFVLDTSDEENESGDQHQPPAAKRGRRPKQKSDPLISQPVRHSAGSNQVSTASQSVGSGTQATASASNTGTAAAAAISGSDESVTKWLTDNKFTDHLSDFKSCTMMQMKLLSRSDLIQICGSVSGILMYSRLHYQRKIFISFSAAMTFTAIYLYDMTADELKHKVTGILKEFIHQQDVSISHLTMTGSAGIEVNVNDEDVYDILNETIFVAHHMPGMCMPFALCAEREELTE
jgi:hypothetical protein